MTDTAVPNRQFCQAFFTFGIQKSFIHFFLSKCVHPSRSIVVFIPTPMPDPRV